MKNHIYMDKEHKVINLVIWKIVNEDYRATPHWQLYKEGATVLYLVPEEELAMIEEERYFGTVI